MSICHKTHPTKKKKQPTNVPKIFYSLLKNMKQTLINNDFPYYNVVKQLKRAYIYIYIYIYIYKCVCVYIAFKL